MMLSFLRPLYRGFGRWVSVYVDTSRRSPAVAEAAKLRWRQARDQLARQGADRVSVPTRRCRIDGSGLATTHPGWQAS